MKKRFFPLLLAAVLFFLVFSLELQVSRYELTSSKLEQGMTFAVVSDLHESYYGKDQSELAEAILAAKPDAVFFAGDMASSVEGLDATRALVRALGDAAPVYWVSGNHEVGSEEKIARMREAVQNMGVHTLDGESVLLPGGVRLAGMGDPYKRDWSAWKKTLASLRATDDVYTVLLTHRPEWTKYYTEGFDLILSGHAHGGQLRLPFLLENGLFAPGQGFFPEHTSGVHDVGAGKMIVSRGLSKGLLPRVFNRPELVIVRIEPA